MGSVGGLNFTAISGQASNTVSGLSKSLGEWAGATAKEAGGAARNWLTTSTPAPTHDQRCLTTFGEAFRDLISCIGQYPNQFSDQEEDRCSCWFTLRRTMEVADCGQYNHTHAGTFVSGQYGQVTLRHHEDMTTKCKPYWDAWLKKNPEPSLWELFSARASEWMSQNPSAVWLIVVLLVAIVACLVFGKCECCREARQGLQEVLTCKDLQDDSKDDRKYDGKALEADGSLSEETNQPQQDVEYAREVAFRNVPPSRSLATGRVSPTSKVTRALRAYPDDADKSEEEEEEWQSVGHYFASMLGYAQEEQPSRYDRAQEGLTLAEFRQQRQAEVQANAVEPLLGRGPAYDTAADYRQNPNEASGNGRYAANPYLEAPQRPAMRSAPAQMRPPPMDTSRAVPFPHRGLGQDGYAGRQDLTV